MDVLAPLIVIVLLGVVVWLVSGPLRNAPAVEEAESARREDLEAAKEAKYREIHDAKLDFRMGKLSESDWRTTDRELRGQAIEILHEIDALGEADTGEPSGR